jgi:hypothetical protein
MPHAKYPSFSVGASFSPNTAGHINPQINVEGIV